MDEFDKEYKATLSHRVRARAGFDLDRTREEITRFLVQLEYDMADGWTPIVRSDHNPPGTYGHDVESQGVHIDLYRDGEKVEERTIAPPMPSNAALNLVEEHLVENYKQHVRRFEQWHNLTRSRDP